MPVQIEFKVDSRSRHNFQRKIQIKIQHPSFNIRHSTFEFEIKIQIEIEIYHQIRGGNCVHVLALMHMPAVVYACVCSWI
jgi:hypothetical protein